MIERLKFFPAPAWPRRIRVHVLLATLPLVAACATIDAPAPRTWLDEATGATVTAQEDPMVLAREDQARAMNVRDYAQIGAAEVNRMGDRQLYLVLLLWSTIDRSLAERERLEAALSRITVNGDDRPVELTRLAEPRRALGFGKPPFPHPAPGTREAYFRVSRDELQSIGLARTLTLTALGRAGEQDSYLEWQNGQTGLRGFLQQLPPRR